jgi:hypothetical protein
LFAKTTFRTLNADSAGRTRVFQSADETHFMWSLTSKANVVFYRVVFVPKAAKCLQSPSLLLPLLDRNLFMSSCLTLPSQMVFKQRKFEIYRTTSQMQAFLWKFLSWTSTCCLLCEEPVEPLVVLARSIRTPRRSSVDGVQSKRAR